MPNDSIYQSLLEASWRRRLTAEEDAQLSIWLAAHPEAQADWEAEAALNCSLEQLPDAPLPSNFTSRVLAAVEREEASAERIGRERGFWLLIQRWLPRTAIAAVVLGFGLVSYHQAQVFRLKGVARGAAAVSGVASLPGPEILSDFDTIRTLNHTPSPDEELLALLK